MAELLGTMTMAAHHSMGSSTRLMIPICSMLCSSFLTFGMSGSGMCPGVLRDTGTAPWLSLTVYSLCNSPRPLHSFGSHSYRVWKLMPSTHVTKPNLVMVGLPSTGKCRLLTTYTSFNVCLPPFWSSMFKTQIILSGEHLCPSKA